jgi:TnpA family transposase
VGRFVVPVPSIYARPNRKYFGPKRGVTWLNMLNDPVPLGDAIGSYGRIFKSLHVLAYADRDETYRRDIKGMRNLQERRHSLAARIYHGRSGELYQHYYKGVEDQLGALGLVLNCVVLWTTKYQDAAIAQLRADGYRVRDEDGARLSPFVCRHLNVHGRYSFLLPDLDGGLRALGDPESPEDEEG